MLGFPGLRVWEPRATGLHHRGVADGPINRGSWELLREAPEAVPPPPTLPVVMAADQSASGCPLPAEGECLSSFCLLQSP